MIDVQTIFHFHLNQIFRHVDIHITGMNSYLNLPIRRVIISQVRLILLKHHMCIGKAALHNLERIISGNLNLVLDYSRESFNHFIIYDIVPVVL